MDKPTKPGFYWLKPAKMFPKADFSDVEESGEYNPNIVVEVRNLAYDDHEPPELRVFFAGADTWFDFDEIHGIWLGEVRDTQADIAALQAKLDESRATKWGMKSEEQYSYNEGYQDAIEEAINLLKGGS